MSAIYLQNQTIKLYNAVKKDEFLGAIEIRTEPSDGVKIYSSGEWVWTSGKWLYETGTWKFNKVLPTDIKLYRVMDLDNNQCFLQIMNHTRWNNKFIPTYEWFKKGDISGGTLRLTNNTLIDFKVEV